MSPFIILFSFLITDVTCAMYPLLKTIFQNLLHIVVITSSFLCSSFSFFSFCTSGYDLIECLLKINPITMPLIHCLSSCLLVALLNVTLSSALSLLLFVSSMYQLNMTIIQFTA